MRYETGKHSARSESHSERNNTVSLVKGYGCHTTVTQACAQSLQTSSQTILLANLVLLSKQQPSKPRDSPTEHDSNVFPAPIDSVTDSSMNPEIITNDPDVRRRVMEEDQSKSNIALFLACTEVTTPHVKIALGSSPSERLDWWRNEW